MMEVRSLQNKFNSVAIYCRLSKDDGSSNDSISIQNQKDVLTEYAIDNGWHIYDYYIDDGFSGTNFERPSFKRMLNDIENGNIQIVLTKDLSRLGRNYLQTGYYTEEYFPLKKVRYIAVNDSFDTINEDGNEIIPFKNLINEWYAKDISKKIRFTVSNKMKNGEYVRTVVPLYGYDFGKDTKVINPDTAPIVKYIFEQYINGYTTAQICAELTARKIYTPSYYNFVKYGYNSQEFVNISEDEKYTWRRIMVRKILEKIEYTGVLVRGKRETKFKRKGAKLKNKEDWYVFDNRFEPIITKDQYDLTCELRQSRRINPEISIGFPYKGLLHCGYCGKPLRINKRNESLNQISGTHRFSCRNKHDDGAGSINSNELEFVLLEELKQLRDLLLLNKNKFLQFAEEFNVSNYRKKKVNIDQVNVEKLKKRSIELEEFIKLSFESYAKGELPKKIYESMVKNYKTELEAIITDLKKYNEIQRKNSEIKNYKASAELIVNYLENLEEEELLTVETLHTLISKIYVKSYGPRVRHQYQNKEITIEYKYIDELIKEFIEYEEQQDDCDIC